MATPAVPTRAQYQEMLAQQRLLDQDRALRDQELVKETEAINSGFGSAREMDAYMANNMPQQADYNYNQPQAQMVVDEVVNPEVAAYAAAMGRTPDMNPQQQAPISNSFDAYRAAQQQVTTPPNPEIAAGARRSVAELFQNVDTQGYGGPQQR